jgi:hypothetical protein
MFNLLIPRIISHMNFIVEGSIILVTLHIKFLNFFLLLQVLCIPYRLVSAK